MLYNIHYSLAIHVNMSTSSQSNIINYSILNSITMATSASLISRLAALNMQLRQRSQSRSQIYIHHGNQEVNDVTRYQRQRPLETWGKLLSLSLSFSRQAWVVSTYISHQSPRGKEMSLFNVPGRPLVYIFTKRSTIHTVESLLPHTEATGLVNY